MTALLGGLLPEPGSARSGEEVFDAGAGFATWLGWRRSASEPPGFPLMLPGGALSFDNTGWFSSRLFADLAGDASHDMWLGFGSAYRGADGVWYNNFATIQREWGLSYSADGSSWHGDLADGDMFYRFRLADGSLSAVHRLAGAGPERHTLWGWSHWYGNSGSYLRLHSMDRLAEIDIFDRLEFKVRIWDWWDDRAAGIFGPVHSGWIARPDDGWPVNNPNRRFVWTFRDGHELAVAMEAGASVALTPNSGSDLQAGAVRSGRMGFSDTQDQTVRTGGAVNGVLGTEWGGGWGYLDMRIDGLRF